MLTVQPKFTNYTAPKAISFKADEGFEDPENSYRDKVDFYRKEAAEFGKMENDSTSPDSLKKMMKGFRVASEALLEGWAVAWGASKGAKFLKSSVASGAKTKFVKGVKDILRPIYKGIKTSGKKIAEAYTKTVEKIKTSKAAERFSNFVENMRKNPVGKYVVKSFEYIGKAFRFVGKTIKAGAKKFAEQFKGKTKSEIYDKATKATANTLGVGAGIAGAYNAATGADKKQVENSDIIDSDEETDPNFGEEVDE